MRLWSTWSIEKCPAHGRGIGITWSLRSFPPQPFHNHSLICLAFHKPLGIGERKAIRKSIWISVNWFEPFGNSKRYAHLTELLVKELVFESLVWESLCLFFNGIMEWFGWDGNLKIFNRNYVKTYSKSPQSKQNRFHNHPWNPWNLLLKNFHRISKQIWIKDGIWGYLQPRQAQLNWKCRCSKSLW